MSPTRLPRHPLRKWQGEGAGESQGPAGQQYLDPSKRWGASCRRPEGCLMSLTKRSLSSFIIWGVWGVEFIMG